MSDPTRTRPLGSPPRRAPATRVPALRLTVTAGPDAGTSVVVARSRATIGRAETADLRLRDPTVSLFHAELIAAEHGVVVVDLASRNGTRAGVVAIERATVPHGTVLHVASSSITVDADAQAVALDDEAHELGALVGGSDTMRELYAALRRLAATDLSLVITGPTGTGKEVAARAVHAAGRRARGPFVVLDCAALPPTLANSVLFGHEKGAFTGAAERRVGLFEAAHGGTLFIDEVGELPLDLQPVLLRVLQQREVLPVGATQPRAVNVRIIAATWRDLRARVNDGAFREDLYYRIAQAVVRMPALSQRRDDVPALVQHFLDGIPSDVRAARGIAREALEAVLARDYPGNVRELRSTVERLAMLADGPVIVAADLAFERMLSAAPGTPSPSVATGAGETQATFRDAKQTLLEEFERAYLARLLERTGNNISRAAALSGIQRHHLRDLLRKHGLRPERGAS